jgi:hypothetical protein
MTDNLEFTLVETGLLKPSTRLGLLAILLLGLLSCGDTPSDATGPATGSSITSVASVTVSPATVSLQEGDTIHLTANVTSVSNSSLTSASVTWTSSNPNVASLSPSNTALAVVVTAEAEGTAVISATSGGKSGTSNFDVTPTPIDVTGQYYMAVGGVPRYLLSLSQTGSSVTFSLEQEGMTLTGGGTVDGRSVSLTTEEDPPNLTLSLDFAAESTSFTGTYDHTSTEQSSNGTVTGSSSPWTTYDVTTSGLPLVIEADYINLESIEWVSLFRSSSGHDFSDDFEACRSMKHYFNPISTVDWSAIQVYSPINGTIVGWSNEGDKGTTITIESSAFPGVAITAFHVSLTSSPAIGDTVAAGDPLGTHYGSGSNSDIAVGIVTPDGYMLVSYFDVMTDDVFQNYEARGAAYTADFVITAAARDADPLTCEGEEFSSIGTLLQRFDLELD